MSAIRNSASTIIMFRPIVYHAEALYAPVSDNGSEVMKLSVPVASSKKRVDDVVRGSIDSIICIQSEIGQQKGSNHFTESSGFCFRVSV